MAYVSPFKKWYCYSCGQKFHLGYCSIHNRKTDAVLKASPTGWLPRLRARFFIETLDGPSHVRTFACRKCPSCQKLLPPNVETARNIIIAVLGDITVGKTHYIAACIDQINPGGPLRHLNEVIECLALNKDVEKKYRDKLYTSLFTNHTPLGVTRPVSIARTEEEKLNDPLIYTLTIRKSPFPEKTYNLIFYDTSGEDLNDDEVLVNYKSWALDPDAIIYIADPLTIPSIEELTTFKRQSQLSPDHVLRWTINLVKQFKQLRGKPLTIPIAITLSKSDLLVYAVPDDVAFRFLGDADYVDGLDMEDIEGVDGEVKALLGKYGAFDLLDARRLSENVSFFATSATGCAADPDTGKFHEVKPRRCLDPLLWILYKLDVISARGNKHS